MAWSFSRRRRTLSVLVAAGLAVAPAFAQSEAPPPDWDRVANIKSAAERLGAMQRARGASAAIKFIDDCYKTHSLAESYTQGFESCIAQDYMETQMLAHVYARMSPEQLKAARVPTPKELADAMGRRVATGFSNYKVPVAYADEFKKLVDEHGFPVLLKILFPNAATGATDTPPPANEK